MPLFTFHRNYMLRTTKGHAISFEKDKPTNVPPVCVEEAVAIGAQPVDGDVDVLGEEEAVVHLTPEERKEKMFKAFRTMVGREIREDFTGTGIPNAKRLPAMTGFDVTSKERDTYWQEFLAAEREQKEQEALDAEVASASAA